MSNLVFVTTDGSAKVPASQRGLIRSHCMRDKNKQPHSRRSRREARRLQATAQGHESAIYAGSAPVRSDESRQESAGDEEPLAKLKIWLPGPTYAPSDWALIKFPVEMDRTAQMRFHQYFACNPVRDPVFPFKLFGIHVDVHTDELWFSGPLLHDELFYRAMELMVESSNDLTCGFGLSTRTRRKLVELLPMLNRRLALPHAHKDGSSLYVVGILASMALLFGDYASASVHAKGIAQIFRLRGSDKTDRTDVMLGLALDRLTFSSSILTDKWTPFYALAVQEPPEFPEEVKLAQRAQNMISSVSVPDERLALVFSTLQCTTILLNTHDFGAPFVNGCRFHDGMGYVQSELLGLKGRLEDGLSECIRLSLMAFLATTFRVPGHWEHPCCASMAKPLLAACTSNKESITRLPSALQTWLLLVGVMTAGAVSQESVRTAWRRLLPVPREPWKTVRREAKRVMWIDSVHDPLGRRAFDFLCLNESQK